MNMIRKKHIPVINVIKEAERWNAALKREQEKKYGRQRYIDWWRKHG